MNENTIQSWEYEDCELKKSKEIQNTDDLMSIYLQEIGKIPLLTKEEEMHLIIQYKKTHNPVFKEKLVEAHLRFVVTIAKKFSRKGLPLLDLIQEGNIGLMYAIEKYEVDYSLRLITYAQYWIYHYVRRAVIKMARTIRIPDDAFRQITDYNKTKIILTNELNRQPTQTELATALQIPEKNIQKLEIWLKDTESLNKPIGEMEDELGNIIFDRTAKSLEEEVIDRIYISEILKILTPEEKEILCLRYGLRGEKPLPLTAIPPILVERNYRQTLVSRELIRLIEKRILNKIRNCNKTMKLDTIDNKNSNQKSKVMR